MLSVLGCGVGYRFGIGLQVRLGFGIYLFEDLGLIAALEFVWRLIEKADCFLCYLLLSGVLLTYWSRRFLHTASY